MLNLKIDWFLIIKTYSFFLGRLDTVIPIGVEENKNKTKEALINCLIVLVEFATKVSNSFLISRKKSNL